MVAACYSLGDLPSHSIKKLSLATLWRKTKKYMVYIYSITEVGLSIIIIIIIIVSACTALDMLQVLIEPGNTAGFQNILEARDMVLDVSE